MDAIVMAIEETLREKDELAKRIERLDEKVRRLKAAQQVDAGDEPAMMELKGPPPALYIAQVVMREEGHPLHSEVIEKLALERHGWRVRKGTIGSQLHRSVANKRGVFFKVKDRQNTYGLVDYKAEPKDFRVRVASK